jgi:uncharacterized delta-60 repeat protein
MSILSWLSGTKSVLENRRTKPARKRVYSRPSLEQLEDRCLLNAGALDPTFGNSAGYVTTALSSGNDQGQRVLLEPSGNIVAAGATTVSVTTKKVTTTVPVFGAVTYNPDGSLDTAFGSGGIVRQLFVGQGVYQSILFDAALEPTGPTGDDKILLAGQDSAQGGLALMRLNPNGGLDTTFGGNGQVITAFQTSGNVNAERADAVAVTNSGQIVAIGTDQSHTWLLARYNPDGSLDTTFGTGGKATMVFSSSALAFDAEVAAVTQQPDGKLVVVGKEYYSNYPAAGTTYNGVVARFNANGSLDTSFGNGGVVITALGTATRIQNRGVALYPVAGTANDGKIVVTGMVFTNAPGAAITSEWAIERYNPNGSLDTTFGNGTGYVIISNPQITQGLRVAQAVTIESDGKPIVVGIGGNNPYVSQVARLNVDGSLDASFGNGGLVTTAVLGTSFANAVAIQPADGKIVVAGYSYATPGSKYYFELARYLLSEPQIGSFTANPDQVTAGSSVTLTASNITDSNPNSTITQVAFYVDSNGDGKLEPSTDTLLGYATQTTPGVWTFTFTVNLAPGTYTLFALAEDSYGVFGDPLALMLTVQ